MSEKSCGIGRIIKNVFEWPMASRKAYEAKIDATTESLDRTIESLDRTIESLDRTIESSKSLDRKIESLEEITKGYEQLLLDGFHMTKKLCVPGHWHFDAYCKVADTAWSGLVHLSLIRNGVVEYKGK